MSTNASPPTSCSESAAPVRVLVVKPRPPLPLIRADRLLRCEPLELEYLATVLACHAVTLLDGVADRRSPVALARRLRPHVVLFTAYITDITTVLALAAQLKTLPEPPLVFVGGVHAEVLPQHFDDPAIDGVFVANQLAGIVEVIARVGRGEEFRGTAGAAFRRAGGLVSNPCPGEPVSALPIPVRSLFARHPAAYRYLHYRQCASVKTSFGCPGRCAFCFCRQMNGGRYTVRPLDEVLAEIEAIPEAETILFVDDNFLVDPARLAAFCEGIAARGVRKNFIAYGTAHFIARHPELLGRLRAAGLRGVIVGLEFTVDADLAAVGKAARGADNEATIDLCRALDIDLFALFIVDPRWRLAEFRALAGYLLRRRLAFATFATLTPFPGTALDDGATAGRPPRAVAWWRYDLLRPHSATALPRGLYYLWLYLLYLLPGLNPATVRDLWRRCGLLETVRLVAQSAITGMEFLLKAFLWR
jgi:radical SAM superfamily enzyme YgiQ (UPF0313 family)